MEWDCVAEWVCFVMYKSVHSLVRIFIQGEKGWYGPEFALFSWVPTRERIPLHIR